MPLFGRKNKKASQVQMGNLGGMKLLVQTPVGVQALQPILDALWEEIAAAAWDGYQGAGHGFVLFDPETGDLDYISVNQIRELPDQEEVLAQCRQYDPATQVVFVTEIVHSRGFRRDPQTAGVILTMPDGGLSPLAAYEMTTDQRMDDFDAEDAVRRQDQIRRQQLDQQHAQRQQKGLDPDAV